MYNYPVSVEAEQFLSLLPKCGRQSTLQDFANVFVQPERPNGVIPDINYNDLELQFLIPSISGMDLELEVVHKPSPPEDIAAFVKPLKSPDACAEIQEKLRDTVIRTMEANETFPMLSLAYGALPEAMEIAQTVDPNRIHSIIVGGTVGTEVKTTKLITPLPDIALANGSIIDDEVLDTGAAIAAVVQAIREKYGLLPNHYLVETLQDSFGKPFEWYQGAYAYLAEQLHEMNILIAVPVWKNKWLHKAILDKTMRIDEVDIHPPYPKSWEYYQQTLLTNTLLIPQDEWAIGWGMDTAIKGTVIWDRMDPAIRDHPLAQPYLEHLKDSQLRVGSSTRGLIALQKNPPGSKNPYKSDEFTAWAVKGFERRLQNIIQQHH